MSHARPARSTADDLLITTGSQQALGLVASALCDPGDTILVEDPTYLAALQTFQLADVTRRRRSRATTTGPDPEALIEAAARDRRQGRLPDPDLPEPDRPHDAAPSAAPRSPRPPPTPGLWLVEDDPYSALRLDGEPVDLLAAQPAARERTIVIQTLSKVLSPGLRIGYLRAPAALRGPLAVAKQAADLHTSTVAQLAAERWLADARPRRAHRGPRRPLPPAPRRAARGAARAPARRARA